MFKDATVVCYNANIRDYRARENKPGAADFPMSARHLRAFEQCAERWITGEGETLRPRPKAAQLLACLQLTPAHLDKEFALRPDTYTVTTSKCPICGSVSDAAICRKCGQHRRATVLEKPWAGAADFCAKWQERAESRNLVIVRKEEHEAAQAAMKRLEEDPNIADFRQCSRHQAWVQANWRDVETGLLIPCRALIGYVPRSDSNWGLCLGGFKTTRDAAHGSWTKQCYFGGYHTAAALALDMWNAATDEDRREFYWVISELTPPYQPARRRLSPMFLNLGRKTYTGLLRAYAACLAKNHWPAYDLNAYGPDGWTPVELEPWMETGTVNTAETQPSATDQPTEPVAQAA